MSYFIGIRNGYRSVPDENCQECGDTAQVSVLEDGKRVHHCVPCLGKVQQEQSVMDFILTTDWSQHAVQC